MRVCIIDVLFRPTCAGRESHRRCLNITAGNTMRELASNLSDLLMRGANRGSDGLFALCYTVCGAPDGGANKAEGGALHMHAGRRRLMRSERVPFKRGDRMKRRATGTGRLTSKERHLKNSQGSRGKDRKMEVKNVGMPKVRHGKLMLDTGPGQSLDPVVPRLALLLLLSPVHASPYPSARASLSSVSRSSLSTWARPRVVLWTQVRGAARRWFRCGPPQ